MIRLEDAHLVLFFTRGVSLQTWDDVGILDRELALYQALTPNLRRVTFVTYGDGQDLRYDSRTEGIRVVCNNWSLPARWYIRSLSLLHPRLWSSASILKSNQVLGAEVALRTAHRFGTRFIARCGYLHSDNEERRHGSDSREAQEARVLEQEVFTEADRVVVTTQAMHETVVQRYQVPAERVVVIPNYVQIDLFRPRREVGRSSKRICFIGRLEEEKNLFALLRAIKGLDVELVIVGNGSLSDELRAIATREDLQVRFTGSVPHRTLPGILNSASVFILPSLYEGHPKALLEAMACGLPVIGTNVPGIRKLIDHRKTGYLCGKSSDEIRGAVEQVVGDGELRARMGQNARKFVEENFSLDRIVEMEKNVMSELLAK